eukprot:33190-Eustigmatos_ZCMA.PRE.1
MEPNRIWSSEQIQVHPELPGVLKEYTKAVIRASPPDILLFSLEWFKEKVKEKCESTLLCTPVRTCFSL